MMSTKLFLGFSCCIYFCVAAGCNAVPKEPANTQATLKNTETVAKTVVEKAAAKDTFTSKVAILLPTQYRKESTGYPKAVKEKKWFQLYKHKTSGHWKIAPTHLKLTYGMDECAGEEVMIIKSDTNDALLFFTQFLGMTTEAPMIMEAKTLFPEHKVSLPLNGKVFNLIPTGSCTNNEQRIMTAAQVKSTPEEELANNIKISNYRLLFEADGKKGFEIAAIKNIEFGNPHLIWAGDLNNDNLPDMILDLADFYEHQHIFFFLSDKNDKERPLKKVAELKLINDC